MESNFTIYKYLDSFGRIDTIIAESENSFEELRSIPSRDKLTFTNGFYVDCSALVVDIRDSSQLTEKHNRPKLAKLYRSYISEVVAVMNGNPTCSEINIIGDGVVGIFNTKTKPDIDSVFGTAYTIASLVDVLNYKLKKAGIEQITVGIGISYGRALMIKAGSKGSGINDVVWMGDVVNEATILSSYGNSSWSDREIMVSKDFNVNLNEHNQNLLEYNSNRHCYHGNVINVAMHEWYQENCSE